MHTSAVHRIVCELSSVLIEDTLGVTKHAIRAAKRDRLFPARWYGPLLQLCDARSIECPIGAFRWIDAARKAEGVAAQQVQPQEGAPYDD